MAGAGYSASGGNAGPATSGANGSVTGNSYAGNGLTINKSKGMNWLLIGQILLLICFVLMVVAKL